MTVVASAVRPRRRARIKFRRSVTNRRITLVCWGEDGHCDPKLEPVSAFDRRPEHRLTPQNITLDITDTVRELGDVDRLEVTLVAVGTEATSDRVLLRFTALTLVTYE